jgi:hypothetical protein
MRHLSRSDSVSPRESRALESSSERFATLVSLGNQKTKVTQFFSQMQTFCDLLIDKILRSAAPSPTALIRWMHFCSTLKLTMSNTDQPSPPGKAFRGVSLTPRSTQRRNLCTFATHREALPGLHLRRWSILRPPRALPPRFSF